MECFSERESPSTLGHDPESPAATRTMKRPGQGDAGWDVGRPPSENDRSRVEADYRGHRIVTKASSHHSNVGGAAELAREAYHGGALGERRRGMKGVEVIFAVLLFAVILLAVTTILVVLVAIAIGSHRPSRQSRNEFGAPAPSRLLDLGRGDRSLRRASDHQQPIAATRRYTCGALPRAVHVVHVPRVRVSRFMGSATSTVRGASG